MTPEQALQKANAAKRIFDDPLTQETLDLMEREVHEAWLACPIRDVEGREACARMAQTVRKFRDLLRGTMESGKLAADQIKRREAAAESLAKRAIGAATGYLRRG